MGADLEFGAGAEKGGGNPSGGGGSSSLKRPPPDPDKNSDDEDSSDEEDSDLEELQMELAKIRKEKEEEKAHQDAEIAAEKEQERIAEIERANPLMNPGGSGSSGSGRIVLGRRWDEDTVFQNQSRTAPEPKRRFINDNMRSDFHKRFLKKYMRA